MFLEKVFLPNSSLNLGNKFKIVVILLKKREILENINKAILN